MCSLILEIGMLIMGILALVRGKISLTRNRVVTGTPARVIGVVLVLPLPLALVSGFVLGIVLVALSGGAPPKQADLVKYALPLEVGIVLLCGLAAVIIGATQARPAKEVLKEELGLPLEGIDPNYREQFAPQPPPEEGIERKDDRLH
jgi:hypothetical protein